MGELRQLWTRQYSQKARSEQLVAGLFLRDWIKKIALNDSDATEVDPNSDIFDGINELVDPKAHEDVTKMVLTAGAQIASNEAIRHDTNVLAPLVKETADATARVGAADTNPLGAKRNKAKEAIEWLVSVKRITVPMLKLMILVSGGSLSSKLKKKVDLADYLVKNFLKSKREIFTWLETNNVDAANVDE